MGERDDLMKIEIKCRDCGTALQWRDDALDTDIISCQGCGKPFGSFGEIKAIARNQAIKHALGHIKKRN